MGASGEKLFCVTTDQSSCTMALERWSNASDEEKQKLRRGPQKKKMRTHQHTRLLCFNIRNCYWTLPLPPHKPIYRVHMCIYLLVGVPHARKPISRLTQPLQARLHVHLGRPVGTPRGAGGLATARGGTLRQEAEREARQGSVRVRIRLNRRLVDGSDRSVTLKQIPPKQKQARMHTVVTHDGMGGSVGTTLTICHQEQSYIAVTTQYQKQSYNSGDKAILHPG